MARRTKEEAQQTRCNIMSLALDLFCQQGLARTSLTDIAKATDLTRGAIYWHFKNKEELFVTLWEGCVPPSPTSSMPASTRRSRIPWASCAAFSRR
jgi:TetR/AcrR family acrAB operon transcriptional repressor